MNEPKSAAMQESMTILESELRTLARMHFAGERADHTLQPTALISEAWLRLAAREDCHFPDLAAFRGWASQAIRSILVDHARKKRALKRGKNWSRASLEVQVAENRWVDVLELNDALQSLAAENERAARVVEMRFFGGMTENEAAQEMGISPRLARKLWAVARARLYGLLGGDESSNDDAT